MTGSSTAIAHAQLQLVDDVERAGIGERPLTTLVQLGRVVAPDRCRAGEYGCAIGLLGADACQGGRDGLEGSSDLFALHHHVQEVRTDAASLEPRLAPAFDRKWVDLAEVGRAFDGRAGEAELCSGRLVVHARVAGVLLLGQHLRRRSQRPDQRLAVTSDLGVETHVAIVPDERVRWREAGP